MMDEIYLKSKTGNPDGGEDRLVLGPRFYGVLDGATSKYDNNWGTREKPLKGGQVIAEEISNLLTSEIVSDASHEDLISIMNETVHNLAKEKGLEISKPEYRSDAALILYDQKEHKIIYLQDGNVGFITKDDSFNHIPLEKSIDKLHAEVRAGAILNYRSIGLGLVEEDFGRKVIMPSLKNQINLQNTRSDDSFIFEIPLGYFRVLENKKYEGWNSQSEIDFNNPRVAKGFHDIVKAIEDQQGQNKLVHILNKQNDALRFFLPFNNYAFKTMDGFAENFSELDIPEGTASIVIASDGFRVLKPTLEETNRILLQQCKEDPECIGVLKGTKGLNKGAQSFDDMSYIRVRV